MKNTTKNYIIRLIFLALVLTWMGIVFKFSNQPAGDSDGTSSRVVKIIVNIIYKSKTIEEKEQLIHELNGPIRKLAHFSIYTIGGFLIVNFVNTYKLDYKKSFIYSVAIGALYACSDEFHQIFIDGRSGELRDVLIDTTGIITGVCIFLCVMKLARGYKSENNKKIQKHDIKNI